MRGMMNTQAKLIVMLYLFVGITSRVEFTNIKCNCLDERYCRIEDCYLKSINRSYKYMSVKVNVWKPPITKLWVNFALYKRSSGYKPFLYNITLDACKFVKNPKSNPVAAYFYAFITDYSNLNHSCPINDNVLILDKMSIDFVNHRITALLPFPEGDYLLESHWSPDNIHNKMVIFKFYVSLI
ncbi:uncharacterized protein LOC111079382 [Drosophila obscura]|uniref:uncharacterized protein LOC111079382 n=1 Tax=Drosophila obscura TaxID=7282 RepID=UPI000BA0D6BC|nr:uncharacterized protein LOC111079382 [Drosophila obscura]